MHDYQSSQARLPLSNQTGAILHTGKETPGTTDAVSSGKLKCTFTIKYLNMPTKT